MYIPAGLIEIRPHMKYQLPTINNLEILPWIKILTLATDGRTYVRTSERSKPPAGRGRGGHKKDYRKPPQLNLTIFKQLSGTGIQAIALLQP